LGVLTSSDHTLLDGWRVDQLKVLARKTVLGGRGTVVDDDVISFSQTIVLLAAVMAWLRFAVLSTCWAGCQAWSDRWSVGNVRC